MHEGLAWRIVAAVVDGLARPFHDLLSALSRGEREKTGEEHQEHR